YADETCDERERVQETDERSRVERAVGGVEMKRNADEQVAEGDPEHQRGHEAGDENPPVPRIAPARIGDLAAIVEAHRTQEKRKEDHDQCDIEARERRRVDERPRGERRSTRGDEPYLVAFPRGADRIEDDAP